MKRSLLIFVSVVALLFAGIGLVKNRGTDRTTSAIGDDSERRQKVEQFWDLYGRATSYRTGGKPELAAREYELALEIDGDHANSLYYLGNMYFALARFGGADSMWHRLVEINPHSARAHSRLGDLFLCLDHGLLDIDRAGAEFSRAHEINKAETGPLIKLGQVALLRNDLDSALYLFSTVASTNAASFEAQFFKGYIAWRRGDLPAAAASFLTAVRATTLQKPTPDVSREGDTKFGGTPLLADQRACKTLEGSVDVTFRGDSAKISRVAARRYRSLDSLIAAAVREGSL